MKLTEATTKPPTEKAKRRIKIAVVAFAAWLLVSWGAARWLIVRAELPNADALVVLAGSSTYLERSRRTAELYREGRAPRVVLTNDGQRGGWNAAEERNPLFAELAEKTLSEAGVPVEKIEIIAPEVSSTFEEVTRLREHVLAQRYGSILVVTSAYQSRRALWTLRKVFEGTGVVVGVAVVEPGDQAPRAAFWWVSSLGWKLVPGEYAKLIYYWLHY